MRRFLDRVVREKKEDIAGKKCTDRVKELTRLAAKGPARDFRRAVSGGRRIIAEIKGKSPTVEAFRQGRSPEKLAEIYEAAGAAAISVVTDARNFGTSLQDVGRVRRVSGLPVLVKDFVIDEFQILEARAAGADAILLIVRILPGESLGFMMRFAERLGMCILVETHDEADIEKAVQSGAGIIGINNRDLDTLEVTLNTTKRLASTIPKGCLSVSESGIRTSSDIEELMLHGVDAFLVGGALLNSDDPGRALCDLVGRNRENV